MSHHYITINIDGVDVTKTFNGWHEYSGIHTDTLRKRYYSGWRGIELLTPTVKYKRTVRPKEPPRYISEWLHRQWI